MKTYPITPATKGEEFVIEAITHTITQTERAVRDMAAKFSDEANRNPLSVGYRLQTVGELAGEVEVAEFLWCAIEHCLGQTKGTADPQPLTVTNLFEYIEREATEKIVKNRFGYLSTNAFARAAAEYERDAYVNLARDIATWKTCLKSWNGPIEEEGS